MPVSKKNLTPTVKYQLFPLIFPEIEEEEKKESVQLRKDIVE